jgi:hypothetical protein
MRFGPNPFHGMAGATHDLSRRLHPAATSAAMGMSDDLLEEMREAAAQHGWSDAERSELRAWLDEGHLHVGVQGSFSDEARRREFGDIDDRPAAVVRRPVVLQGRRVDDVFHGRLREALGL